MSRIPTKKIKTYRSSIVHAGHGHDTRSYRPDCNSGAGGHDTHRSQYLNAGDTAEVTCTKCLKRQAERDAAQAPAVEAAPAPAANTAGSTGAMPCLVMARRGRHSHLLADSPECNPAVAPVETVEQPGLDILAASLGEMVDTATRAGSPAVREVALSARRPAALTPAAREALINIGTRRQGATIAPNVPGNVFGELHAAGLVGKGGGLTRTGSIKRELLVSELLDTML